MNYFMYIHKFWVFLLTILVVLGYTSSVSAQSQIFLPVIQNGSDSDLPLPLAPNPNCTTSEHFHTAQVNGVYEAFVDNAGIPHLLNGINVRRVVNSQGQLLTGYNQANVQALKEKGFDVLRLALDWPSFHTGDNQFNQTAFDSLDTFITYAENANLYVILDPIHIKSVGDPHYWNVPAWAWDGSVSSLEAAKTEVFGQLQAHGLTYLSYILRRYCNHANVIAIDLVNEPREPDAGSTFWARNDRLIALYDDWIASLRTIDADKLLILEPYYGSAQVSASNLAQLHPSRRTNVIWSTHDYYAGGGAPPRQDGYSTGWGRYATVSPRTESWKGRGDYPTADDERATRRSDTELHLSLHQNAANANGLPLFIGEYGLPHGVASDPNHSGWNGKYEFLCDKTLVYDALRLSRTVWEWTSTIDEGFTLWHVDTGQWHAWTDGIFDCLQPSPESGDGVAQIAYTSTAPSINGVVGYLWEDIPRYRLSHVTIGDSVSTSDLSAHFSALYDNQNLYILVEVTDDILSQDSGDRWWYDDTIELFIDGDGSANTRYDGQNDFQLAFGSDNQFESGTNSAADPHPDYAVLITEKGYTLEVAIPLANLDIEPTDGYRFGLDVHINDDDEGGRRKTKLAWFTTEDESWYNPNSFGIGELASKP